MKSQLVVWYGAKLPSSVPLPVGPSPLNTGDVLPVVVPVVLPVVLPVVVVDGVTPVPVVGVVVGVVLLGVVLLLYQFLTFFLIINQNNNHKILCKTSTSRQLTSDPTLINKILNLHDIDLTKI